MAGRVKSEAGSWKTKKTSDFQLLKNFQSRLKSDIFNDLSVFIRFEMINHIQ